MFCYIKGKEIVEKEIIVGEKDYARLTIPPGIWFGFKGVAKTSSLILNIADIPHDPGEVDHIAIDKLNYCWER